jgi:hypothetical protein
MRRVIKKVVLKNTLYFVKYKKDKFLTVNSSTQVRHFISLLSENLSFLYFLKYKVFFNKTFLCTLLVSKSIYIFNHIIFKDTKVWGFEKFQNTKSDRSIGVHVHKTFSVIRIGKLFLGSLEDLIWKISLPCMFCALFSLPSSHL